ncbi:MAG: hypothetical protein AAB074_16125 [Planctomycetota bacterium]
MSWGQKGKSGKRSWTYAAASAALVWKVEPTPVKRDWGSGSEGAGEIWLKGVSSLAGRGVVGFAPFVGFARPTLSERSESKGG